MITDRPSSPLGYWLVGGTLGLTLILPFLLPELSGTMPHAHCYLWRSDLMWLHGGSDGLIGLAYMGISVTLFTLLYRIRESIPFRWMIFAFGVFIVACGLTHFLSIWTLFEPVYFLSGSVKGVTAVASVITAIALPPLVPRIIGTIRAARESEGRRRELEVLYRRVKVLDEEKSRFFANISHDLRTPITLITAPGESLLERDDLPDDLRASLSTIVRNAYSLDERVGELLDLSRLEADRVELEQSESDVARIVRLAAAAFADVARISSIDFSVETPEHLVMRLDRAKLDRVLLNLLGNAFKFTPAGGSIGIRLAEEGSHVIIDVLDSGPGIPEEDRQKVFDPYRQSESTRRLATGSGLGLSIARSFVELHGGTIEILGPYDAGAHFRVRLPSGRIIRNYNPAILPDEPNDPQDSGYLTTPEITPAETDRPASPGTDESAPDTVPVNRPVVLVVEDNDEMRAHVAEVLSKDFTVVTAADAEDGLAWLESARPSAVISDLMMPGIDGEEFLGRIRGMEGGESLPVIFLSARGEEETRVRLLNQGAQDYISKPFSPRELRSRVASFVISDRYQQGLKNRFDLLWRSNIIAMGISHLDGRISEANDSFLTMLGYTREDLEAGTITIGTITHPESEEVTKTAISDARAKGIVGPFEKSYVHRTGREVPVIVGGARVEGTVDELLFVAQDLSEIRQAALEIRKLNEELEERVALRTSALQAVNQDLKTFSYSVSHDLRAPLRAIGGFTRFLQEDYASNLDDTGRDYLSRIERNVLVMEEMIAALLGLSRATRESIDPVLYDVSSDLAEIVTSLRAADAGRQVDVSWDRPIRVEADPPLFRLVMENLIHNAWKFTGSVESARIEIRGIDTPDAWIVTVADNGVGFDMKDSARIFEPFGRLHSANEFAGTGIGLSTVHTIIRRHAGEITAESAPGMGTTFTVTLPRPARVEPIEEYGE